MAMKALKAYHEETRRPVYSAVLVLPFVLVYELGIIVLQPRYINGGDALIRRLLSGLTAHTAFASAVVLGACFAWWQYRKRASWEVDSAKLTWLTIESLCFALFLRLSMGWLHCQLPRCNAPAGEGPQLGPLETLVLYCGAGVYEELVFRVLLLGLLMLVLTKLLHMEEVHAAMWSVGVGALLFSLFHYVGQDGSQFAWNSFLQRTFAGVFFAVLYMFRSFGVAAATHAFYDILVGFTLA